MTRAPRTDATARCPRLSSRHPTAVRVAAGIAIFLYLGGLFIGGAQPAAVGLIPPPWDKLAHAAAFGALAVLADLALQPPLWLLLAIPLLVSAADEAHQTLLPGRSPDVDDWLAAATGVALAVWLLRGTRARRRNRRIAG